MHTQKYNQMCFESATASISGENKNLEYHSLLFVMNNLIKYVICIHIYLMQNNADLEVLMHKKASHKS